MQERFGIFDHLGMHFNCSIYKVPVFPEEAEARLQNKDFDRALIHFI